MSGGFAQGRRGPKGKDAYLAFMSALLSSPEGARFEIGIMWDPESKWCVYQRVGDAAMRMSAREARKIADLFERHLQDPQWASLKAEWSDNIRLLRELAVEIGQKNTAGVLPENWQMGTPSKGSA